MGRRLLVVLGAVLATAIVGVTPIAAGEDAGGTYLSLGDSVAAGTQQPQPFASNGYAEQLFKGLRDEYGFDKLVNLACPGDDTVWMRFGIGGGSPSGSACYGPSAQLPPGGTSQLDAAVAYMTSHPGEVELITIAIGANDILSCDPSDLRPSSPRAWQLSWVKSGPICR